MITPLDEAFRREIAKFNLQCTCEACAAFDTDANLCAYGYPTEPHRRLPLAGEPQEFVFCKAFELA